jgi:hypothetical protein
LLLLGGQLLLGGKQDRIVAEDTTVPPGKTMDVRVYCVEHGRWEGSSTKFDSGDTTVPYSVRKAATYGQQTDVWQKVGEYNAAAKAPQGVTTVRAGLQSAGVQKRVDTSLAAIEKSLRANKNAVGVMLVLNGQIQTVELFGNTKLFNAAARPMLKGFLAEAAVAPTDAKAKVSMKECSTFLSDTLKSKQRFIGARAGAASYDVSGGANVRGRTYGAEAGKVPAAAATPGTNGFIHGTYSREAPKRK